MPAYDAIVVGAGPNGLAAAIRLAQAGLGVLVRESQDEVGGGMRTAALTLPGYVHDVCAAVHPLGRSSPFFCALPLAEHGLEWIEPPAALAHPFDDGRAAVLERSFEATGATLGRKDAQTWESLFRPISDHWDGLVREVLAPLHLPRHPVRLARFGLRALQPVHRLVHRTFESDRARALFAAIAGHSMAPLEWLGTSSFGLLLGGAAHAVGWPIIRGGTASMARAMASYLRSLGGEIQTNAPVNSVDELPAARAVLLDLTPRQVVQIAGRRLPEDYRQKLERYRYGPGVFKVDWALAGPIPWRAHECFRAGTVHLAGSYAEVRLSEDGPWQGIHPERPMVLASQPTLFDGTRAPEGGHIAWGYCHVPHASTRDMTDVIEAQVERFAPGFRDLVLRRCSMGPLDLERHNPNLVGGDIAAGAMDLRQLFFRPTIRAVPYATPVKDLYICSAATPPGGAVHGMCGFYAAEAALRGTFK